ncbi:MAG TPA: DivIVA domain-containing protein [Candidatus Aphodomorpha intestinavium]|uniref:DivIVA domain-containing protein n=1 Tax=Candidatus Aphodomorpha intestinavium TaxID=2840672 RepID=A0A9D1N252_9FIRM|nr:DivIVA domain-containing protein [Candidatus Aphodomorpha intestinavium]
MISIDDIVKKEFSRSFLGYDMREVDLFLDAIIEQLEADERERQEMLTAMEYLLRELEQFDDIAGDADRQLRESVEAVRRAAAPRTRAVHVNPVVPPADPAAEPAPEEAGEAVVLEEYEVYAAAPQDEAPMAQAESAQQPDEPAPQAEEDEPVSAPEQDAPAPQEEAPAPAEASAAQEREAPADEPVPVEEQPAQAEAPAAQADEPGARQAQDG